MIGQKTSLKNLYLESKELLKSDGLVFTDFITITETMEKLVKEMDDIILREIENK